MIYFKKLEKLENMIKKYNFLLITILLFSSKTLAFAPKIDMAFGTRTAIVAQEVCNSGGSTCSEDDADGMCNFYIEEPQVTLTIQ